MSAIVLRRGQSAVLGMEGGPLVEPVYVGMGWVTPVTGSTLVRDADFEVDAMAFLLDGTGHVRSNGGFVFYNQLSSACGKVTCDFEVDHEEDNEQVLVYLGDVEPTVERICFALNIDLARERKQHFGQVSEAFLRVFRASDGRELVRYAVETDFDGETSMVLAELVRHGRGWSLKAVGQGLHMDLAALVTRFGVAV